MALPWDTLAHLHEALFSLATNNNSWARTVSCTSDSSCVQAAQTIQGNALTMRGQPGLEAICKQILEELLSLDKAESCFL